MIGRRYIILVNGMVLGDPWDCSGNLLGSRLVLEVSM